MAIALVLNERVTQQSRSLEQTSLTVRAVLRGLQGSELALGFAVNGIVRRDEVNRKGAMSVGQALILTKPVGTGVLFAADMRCKAKGFWIDQGLDSMR